MIQVLLFVALWFALAFQFCFEVPAQKRFHYDYGIRLPALTKTIYRIDSFVADVPPLGKFLLLMGLMLPGLVIINRFQSRPPVWRLWYWLRAATVLSMLLAMNVLLMLSWTLATWKLQAALEDDRQRMALPITQTNSRF